MVADSVACACPADLLALQRLHPAHEPAVGVQGRELGADGELARVPRIDRQPLDVLGGARLQPHRPVDAAEQPVVGAALRQVDGLVRGELADGHLQQVLFAEPQQGRDRVAELVEPALVHRAGRLAVDEHLGVGHGRAEHDVHRAATPGLRHNETVPVPAGVVGRFRAALPVAPVAVGAEALHLPVGRHGDLRPHAGLPAATDLEIPGHGVVGPGAAEQQFFGCLRVRDAGDKNQKAEQYLSEHEC
jgi:hypothetical protein